MENVKKYSGFIKRVFTAPASIRKKLLSSSNPLIVTAIAEILLNIYHRNIPGISRGTLKSMKKVKTAVLKIINVKTAPATRKELLIRHCDSFVGIAEKVK